MTSAAAAIGGYIDHYLDKLLELIPAAAAGDVEAVHDTRAALRRVLSVDGGYGKSLFKAKKAQLKAARAVVRPLGAVRDPQVALERLSQPPLPQDVASLPALRRDLEGRADTASLSFTRSSFAGAQKAPRGRSASETRSSRTMRWPICSASSGSCASACGPRPRHFRPRRHAGRTHAERKALKRVRYMAESLQAWASDGTGRVAVGAEQRQEALGPSTIAGSSSCGSSTRCRLKGVSEDDVVRLLARRTAP